MMYNPAFVREVHEKRRTAGNVPLSPVVPKATEKPAQYVRRSLLIEASRRAMQEQRAKRERELVVFERNLAIANEAIAKANEAARRFNDVNDSAARIMRRICRVFKVSRHDILADRRDKQLVLARQASMYWIARMTGLSLPRIGKMMGGRDHTTILHGKRIYIIKRAAMGRHLREVR